MRMQIFRVKKPSGKILKTKNFAPFEVQYTSKEVSYKTLVRSELEYAASICNLSSETHIKQIVKVQDCSLLGLQEISNHT